MVGWKKEKLRFILEEMKIMAKWRRKKIKHEESCVVQNYVQLYTTCSPIITVRWLCVYVAGLFCWPLTVANAQNKINDTNNFYLIKPLTVANAQI